MVTLMRVGISKSTTMLLLFGTTSTPPMRDSPAMVPLKPEMESMPMTQTTNSTLDRELIPVHPS
jgi:hypothetical protein